MEKFLLGAISGGIAMFVAAQIETKYFSDLTATHGANLTGVPINQFVVNAPTLAGPLVGLLVGGPVGLLGGIAGALAGIVIGVSGIH